MTLIDLVRAGYITRDETILRCALQIEADRIMREALATPFPPGIAAEAREIEQQTRKRLTRVLGTR